MRERFDAVLVGRLLSLSFVQADNHCKTLAETLCRVVESMMLPYSPEDYPYLTEFTTEYILQPGYKFGAEFEYGLALLIDSLEAAAHP